MVSSESGLFDFRPSATQPVLLLIDRRNDPVTPLLTQWTYQAMVHDVLGITNGRVDLSSAPDIKDDLREIVISPEQDSFFAKNLYNNFGDLGANVKSYVSDYQAKSFSTSGQGAAKGQGRIETIADMKRFVEEYPEFRKLGGNVSKHVALIGELSRIVEVRKLLEISELEQSLACSENHRDDLRVGGQFSLSRWERLTETDVELARPNTITGHCIGQQAPPRAAIRAAISEILCQRDQPNHRFATQQWRP